MKKLRVNWPAIIGISVALALVSCHNEKKMEDYKKQQVNNNTKRIEETYKEALESLYHLNTDEVIYPEDYQQGNGYSK